MTLIELYRRSLNEFVDRAEHLRPEDWARPTPCAEWDVRALVNHIVGEDRWTVPLIAGETIAEVGDRFAGDLLGDDPIGTAVDAAKQAESAVVEPGAIERNVDLSSGRTPAREYLHELLADHLIHAWDLASAVGGSQRLNPEVVHAVAEWFAPREELYRKAGVIGPRVEVPEGADEQDRLLAAFGRDPAWTAPDGGPGHGGRHRAAT